MTHTRIKLTVAGLGLAIAVTYLALAGVKEGWVYHMPVDQFLKSPEVHKQRVRLAGKVAAEDLQVNPGRLTASFTLHDEAARVPVLYRGTIPEMFKADGEVVVEGRLDATGVFQADVLMTKCASKYQSEEHAQRLKEKT